MTTRKTQYIQVLGAIGILLPGLFAPLVVNATNGLFGHGFGARQGGIAGSGVAFPQDALAASLNPAGMVYVGRRNDIGVSLFNPERSYEVTGFSPPPPAGFPPFATSGEIDSDSTLFVIPDLGFNWPLDDMSSIGLSIYGNGGMNTDWQAKDTPFGVGTFGAAAVPGALTNAGVNYAELFAALTYSRKFTGNASWGIAGLFNYSRIKMQGLAAFAPFSLDPARLTDQGYDSAVGFGARLGIQGQVGDSVTLGAAYQTKIPNTFDDYAGLFPNGGELDIPPVAQVGLAWKT
ncbi:MAG: outer membrane protein transport protein, partial [Gammaproteobacteria bacterium]|nr:outer membrane protein transport protein [Gammaproteobacteria bacterium]